LALSKAFDAALSSMEKKYKIKIYLQWDYSPIALQSLPSSIIYGFSTRSQIKEEPARRGPAGGNSSLVFLVLPGYKQELPLVNKMSTRRPILSGVEIRIYLY
jgi:hypothetical protein